MEVKKFLTTFHIFAGEKLERWLLNMKKVKDISDYEFSENKKGPDTKSENSFKIILMIRKIMS